MIKNIRHTGIVVNNVNRSLEFYCDLLGFEVKKDNIESGSYLDSFLGMKKVRVRTIKLALKDEVVIELLYFYSRHKRKGRALKLNSIGCTHMAMTVENLEVLYDNLVDAEVEFNSPPTMSGDVKVKVAFCQDPDGTFLELVEELS